MLTQQSMKIEISLLRWGFWTGSFVKDAPRRANQRRIATAFIQLLKISLSHPLQRWKIQKGLKELSL